MNKIYFDMDGTIADLYGVENWLDYLVEGNPYPYLVAKPMVNFSVLARHIHKAQKAGFEVGVISWLAKNSNEEYDELVTLAKMTWLKKHLPSVEWDGIYVVPYGTPKSIFNYEGDGISYLFDDEENNRTSWQGMAYSEKYLFEALKHN